MGALRLAPSRSPDVKLYNADLSPFSARCRIQIYAKGLPVEIVEPPQSLHSDAYRALNPIGKVPSLELDGTVIPESEVICEYLEDAFPTTPLRPADPLGRARVRLLSRFADLYVVAPLTALFGQMNPKTRSAKLVEEKLGELGVRFDQLETLCVAGPFAAGPELTLADCALAPIFFFATRLLPALGGASPVDGHPKLARLHEANLAHPAVARALGEMSVALEAMLKGGLPR
jgi:glutathione S-transferase